MGGERGRRTVSEDVRGSGGGLDADFDSGHFPATAAAVKSVSRRRGGVGNGGGDIKRGRSLGPSPPWPSHSPTKAATPHVQSWWGPPTGGYLQLY